MTQDPVRRILRGASVRIEEGKIQEMGKIARSAKDDVIDCSHKLLIPGLINTHTHLSMTMFRGYADDLELQAWLNKIWALEKKLTGKMCYDGALLGCLEMIRTGTTCFVDMYFHMEDVAKATAEAGLRGILSHGIIDPPDDAGIKRQKDDTLEFLKNVREMNNSRIEFAVGPHAPYTCREETLLWSSELAEREDSLVNIHIAETRHEQAQFEREKRMRVVEYLDKIGFLSERVLAAHSVWLTKNEVNLYGRNRVRVAHCPVSNMKLAGGGAAPVPEMWEANVPVGLGTDGPASNNGLDMFDTMKVGALLHKAWRWDSTVANAQKILDMATIDGARAIGKEKQLGSIERGKKADLVLIDLRDPNMVPIHGEQTIISDIVYAANGFNVDSTIVDGKPLMVSRKLQTLDPKMVSASVTSSVSQLLAK